MMETLKDWAQILIITSFAGCLGAFILPDSNEKTAKYVKFACSLAAAAVMLAPLQGFLQYLPETGGITEQSDEYYSDGISQTKEWIIEKTVEDLKSALTVAIYQKTGITVSDIQILLKQSDLEEDIVTLEMVRIDVPAVEIREKMNTDTDSGAEYIKNYISELLSCTAEIIVID